MPISISLNASRSAAIPKRIVRRGVRLALESEGCSQAEISITFLDDEPIQDLNLRWLGHDWIPDVLSFPLQLPDPSSSGAALIGDIYIGVEQAERQAREHGVSREQELVRLAIHGTLHILGYDHTDEEARTAAGVHFMRQEELVRQVLATSSEVESTGGGRRSRSPRVNPSPPAASEGR